MGLCPLHPCKLLKKLDQNFFFIFAAQFYFKKPTTRDSPICPGLCYEDSVFLLEQPPDFPGVHRQIQPADDSKEGRGLYPVGKPVVNLAVVGHH